MTNVIKFLDLGMERGILIQFGASEGRPGVERRHGPYTSIDAFEFVPFVLQCGKLVIIHDRQPDTLLHKDLHITKQLLFGNRPDRIINQRRRVGYVMTCIITAKKCLRKRRP